MEDRIICDCLDIKYSQIRKAIEENSLKTVEDVAAETEAGYCCGGCGDDIQEILNEVAVIRKAS